MAAWFVIGLLPAISSKWFSYAFGSGVVEAWAEAVGLRAQQRSMPVLGFLAFTAENTAREAREGLWQGLHEQGYIEGRNIAIEYRFADESGGDFAELAEQLVRHQVDIILAAGHPAALAAQRATPAIPIVTVVADPIGSGFATSLAHPGGNIMGFSLAVEEQFSGKWLELFSEAAPQVSRVAYLWNPTNHSSASSRKVMQALAPQIGLILQSVELQHPEDLSEALAAIIRNRAEGIIVDSDAIMGSIYADIAEFASANRLPTISVFRRFVDAGGLMSYGPNLRELWRRATTYIDKILRGAKPADLPIEQPTKFELVVNLKTAKALGLTIPPLILSRADEVIE